MTEKAFVQPDLTKQQEQSFVQTARGAIVAINRELDLLAQREIGRSSKKARKDPLERKMKGLEGAIANLYFIQTYISPHLLKIGQLRVILHTDDGLLSPTAVVFDGKHIRLENYWGLDKRFRQVREVKSLRELKHLWNENGNGWTKRVIGKFGGLSRWEIVQAISKTIEPLAGVK